MRVVCSAAVFMAVIFAASGRAEDPIRKTLDDEKAKYQKAMDDYHTEVKTWFDDQDTAIRKQPGSTEKIKQLKAELAAFEKDGTLPKGVSAAVRERPKKAREAMLKAFTEAADRYTMAKKDDLAAGVEKERDEFRKGGGAEPPTKGADWKKVAGELNQFTFGDKKTDLDGLRAAFDTGGVGFARADEFRTRLLKDVDTLKTARDGMLNEKATEKEREASYQLALSKVDAMLAPYNSKDWSKSGLHELNGARAEVAKMRERFVSSHEKR